MPAGEEAESFNQAYRRYGRRVQLLKEDIMLHILLGAFIGIVCVVGYLYSTGSNLIWKKKKKV
jgi:hypothetical protein